MSMSLFEQKEVEIYNFCMHVRVYVCVQAQAGRVDTAPDHEIQDHFSKLCISHL